MLMQVGQRILTGVRKRGQRAQEWSKFCLLSIISPYDILLRESGSRHDTIGGMKRLTLSDYQALAEFRYQIRRFFHFSEQAVKQAGLERVQYQLMLAIKGMPASVRPRIRELANRMEIRHHSAVELVNRLEAGGFVHRTRAHDDRREVLLMLTPKGRRCSPSLRFIIMRNFAVPGPNW
jgi:DNA-binding MarR family transcriptional regulator